LSTGEDKYEQYIKAADIVAATVGKMQYEGMCRTYSMDAFDKFMFKLHAPEILEVVEVPTGKTPPHNPYVAWMSGWINEAYK
jgi:hypothetical protein